MSERILWLLFDTYRARKQGRAAITQRQRARLAELVAFARAHSPFYGELYQGLPERVEDPTLLPVTDKKRLMARFDEWATDRAVTIEKPRAFAEDPARIGERFLSRYTLATTSGTTGTPRIFLLDDRTLSVTNALAVRMLSAWLGVGDVVRILTGSGRMSMVMATGGHFASTVAAARLRRSRWGRKALQVLSVHMLLPDIVSQLNRFRPVIVAPYASLAALLADEQEAGRLHIHPVLLVLSAEGLPADEYDRIASVFRAKVRDSYAATECTFLSYRCRHGWLHVNADWVVLEPGDPASQSEDLCRDEQAFADAALVVCLAELARPVQHDRDGHRRVRNPIDRGTQLADPAQGLLITNHDEVPRLGVAGATRPPSDLQQLVHGLSRNRVRPVLANLAHLSDLLQHRARLRRYSHDVDLLSYAQCTNRGREPAP